MPDSDKPDGSPAGDADSSTPPSPQPAPQQGGQGGGLWSAIRGLFEDQSDNSLRAQIEEAIDEHDTSSRKRGDLSPVEVASMMPMMWRSRADRLSPFRPIAAGPKWSRNFPNTAIRACRFSAKSWMM